MSMCRMLQAPRQETDSSVDVVSPMLPLVESLLRPQMLIFDAVALTCIWFRVEQCINRFLSNMRMQPGEVSKSAFAVYPVSLASVRICFMQLFWFNIESLSPASQDAVAGSTVQQFCITDAGSSWLRKRLSRDDSADASAALSWNRVFTQEL